MEAGRELDALVAVSVMGWHKRERISGPDSVFALGTKMERWYAPNGREGAVRGTNSEGVVFTNEGLEPDGISAPHPLIGGLPWYSTDIAAAWQVVEKVRTQGHFVEIDCLREQYEVYIDTNPAHTDEPSAYAPTAQHAICLAALKAVGVEVE